MRRPTPSGRCPAPVPPVAPSWARTLALLLATAWFRLAAQSEVVTS